MKGILKIYHPEETLKYNLDRTYCKAVYLNKQHFLEVEVLTDDSVEHVDDDSLQYNFPQLRLSVSDFPIEDDVIEGKTFEVEDSDENFFTEVDLFDDEDAYVFNNKLNFCNEAEKGLHLYWQGEISDFYTGSDEPIPFKLKCNFLPDEIMIDED